MNLQFWLFLPTNLIQVLEESTVLANSSNKLSSSVGRNLQFRLSLPTIPAHALLNYKQINNMFNLQYVYSIHFYLYIFSLLFISLLFISILHFSVTLFCSIIIWKRQKLFSAQQNGRDFTYQYV